MNSCETDIRLGEGRSLRLFCSLALPRSAGGPHSPAWNTGAYKGDSPDCIALPVPDEDSGQALRRL